MVIISSVMKLCVVQLLSHIWLFVTPWTAACRAFLSFAISWSCSDSHPLIWWCYLTTSSSVAPFSCPWSLVRALYLSVRGYISRSENSTQYATQEITGGLAEYLLLYCIPSERCQLMLLATVCDNLIECISVKNNFNRMYPRFSRTDLLKNSLSCYPIDSR